MGEANQARFGGGIVRTDDTAHVGCGRGNPDGQLEIQANLERET
jgi:hypothetical protein